MVVYVGRTNNMVRRQREHRSRYKLYKKDNKKYYKLLYKHLDSININVDDIILTSVYNTSIKVDSKRWEMWEILRFYFTISKKHLKQRVPPISR